MSSKDIGLVVTDVRILTIRAFVSILVFRTVVLSEYSPVRQCLKKLKFMYPSFVLVRGNEFSCVAQTLRNRTHTPV